MDDNPHFRSDRRTPASARWSDKQDWLAGNPSNVTVGENAIMFSGNSGDFPQTTGGEITQLTVGENDYRLHAFTEDGTFTIGSEQPVDVLVVAGGGSGGVGGDGSWEPGGGGAGGVIQRSGYLVSGTIPVTIGMGGPSIPGSRNATPGKAGENSIFDTLTTIGGGRGGAGSTNGGDGGSGGGGSHTSHGGSGTSTQGNRGGNGSTNTDNWSTEENDGGGGGGAKERGNVGEFASGGDGQYYGNIFGQAYGENGYFGGGGMGGWRSPELNPTRGIGGGGVANGGIPDNGNAGYGHPNTGGGGGGAVSEPDQASSASGQGGSGIVLVRVSAV